MTLLVIGSAPLVMLMLPVTDTTIVSIPAADPAMQLPDGAFVLAAMSALRKVQAPGTTPSVVVVTVIVAARADCMDRIAHATRATHMTMAARDSTLHAVNSEELPALERAIR